MSNTTETLDYTLIIPLAIRELTVDVFGKKIKVTEKLFKDPAPIQAAREKLFTSRGKVQAMLDRRTAGTKPDETEDTAAVEAAEVEAIQGVLDQFDMAIEGDDRMLICRNFCQSIIATSLVGADSAPMPLVTDELYASPVPTQLLTMILDACAKVPYVSKK